MKYFNTVAFIITLSFAGHLCQANDKIITYVKPEGIKDNRSEYFVKLLALALEKTATPLNTRHLKATPNTMKQGRAIHELAQGRSIDVVWTVTSVDREKQLLPVRIPLLKGLLGHRVLLIRKEDKNKFAAVNNIKDLQQYTAGQGHDWPDTEILRANQFTVTTTSTYDGLFEMLAAHRFDFFPRGINEAWQEIETQANPNMIVEDNILLYYPSPIYFFVNNHAQLLAKRLEKGLTLSIEDGSFDRLFYSYHPHKKMFAMGRLNQRKVITLSNPLLPPLTPLKNKKLWYNLK
ncbi:hypothetical protein A9Q74_12910 [Colwellia sp. 39_35_sub15_T18]|nr:hypothetical protein A9Q74_12910 [Colwellia sp. 39_35_sub15_T18]